MDIISIIYLSVLIMLGVFFVNKMFNPPVVHDYKLKTIVFAKEAEKSLKTTERGKQCKKQIDTALGI